MVQWYKDSSTVLPHNQSLSPAVQNSSTALPRNQSLGPVVQNSSTVLSHNQSLSPAAQGMQDSATRMPYNRRSSPMVPVSQGSSFTSAVHNDELNRNILIGDDTATAMSTNPRCATSKAKIKIVPDKKIKSPIIQRKTEASSQDYSMITTKKTKFSATPSSRQDPLVPLSKKQEHRKDSLIIPSKKRTSPGPKKQNLKPSLRQDSVTQSPHGTVASLKDHRNKRQEFNASPKRNPVVLQFKKPKFNPIDHAFLTKDPPGVIPKIQEKEVTSAKQDSVSASKQKPADRCKKKKKVTWKGEKTDDEKETQEDQWVLRNWDEKQARYSPFCRKHNVHERKVEKTEVDWSLKTLSLLVYGSSAQDLSTTNTKHTETLTETQKGNPPEPSPTKLMKSKWDEDDQDEWSDTHYDVSTASKDQDNNTSHCDGDEILSTDDEIYRKEVIDVDKDAPITNKDKNNNPVSEKNVVPSSDDDIIEIRTVTSTPSKQSPKSQHIGLKANEQTNLRKQRRIRAQQWQRVKTE